MSPNVINLYALESWMPQNLINLYSLVTRRGREGGREGGHSGIPGMEPNIV